MEDEYFMNDWMIWVLSRTDNWFVGNVQIKGMRSSGTLEKTISREAFLRNAATYTWARATNQMSLPGHAAAER